MDKDDAVRHDMESTTNRFETRLAIRILVLMDEAFPSGTQDAGDADTLRELRLLLEIHERVNRDGFLEALVNGARSEQDKASPAPPQWLNN